MDLGLDLGLQNNSQTQYNLVSCLDTARLQIRVTKPVQAVETI